MDYRVSQGAVGLGVVWRKTRVTDGGREGWGGVGLGGGREGRGGRGRGVAGIGPYRVNDPVSCNDPHCDLPGVICGLW